MSNIQALYDTLEVLDEGALIKAINLLTAARRILIVGVGTSGPIVHSMYNMLMRLGLNCKAETDSYLQLMEVALLGPGDVVVAISHPAAPLIRCSPSSRRRKTARRRSASPAMPSRRSPTMRM